MLNSLACLRNLQTALRLGAKRALAYHDRPDRIQFPGKDGWISSAHEEVFQIISLSITQAYPDHKILRPDGRNMPSITAPFVWIIDPIDGVDNFTSGIGFFSISAVLYVNGKPALSAIYAPISDELFTAVLGSGAQLNGRKMRITGNHSHSAAHCIGLSSSMEIHSVIQNLMPKSIQAMSIRQFGCLSLSIAYHACARLTCVLASDYSKPSIAAAHLLATESGSIGKFFTLPNDPQSYCIYAPPGLLPKHFLQQIQNESP